MSCTIIVDPEKVMTPHPVTDNTKLAQIISALRSGYQVPPVVIHPDGVTALTGSHRIAAGRLAGYHLEAVIVTSQELEDAIDELGGELEWESADGENRARALYLVTSREPLHAALDDQR